MAGSKMLVLRAFLVLPFFQYSFTIIYNFVIWNNGRNNGFCNT